MPKILGFFIHPDKYIFTPHHNIIFLSYHTNTQRMIAANDMINKEATMKDVLRLLGNLAVSTEAVQYGRSHYHYLEYDKITTLKNSNGSFDTPELFFYQQLKS